MATFTNFATLTYNGNTINSNVVTGEIQEVLSAVKTAVRDTYGAGEDVTYVISLTNTGTTDYDNLTLTDNLGGYALGQQTLYPLTYVDGVLRYYVNGVLQPTPAVTAGPPMTITGIAVPAGGNALIVYEVNVNNFAPLGADGTVLNRVELTGDGLAEAIVAEETVSARVGADVSITKSLNPVVVPENGQLTYTFTIQNFGNEAVVSTDNAVLADTFNPILRDITVVYNGAAWAAPGNYTYNEATGVFSTVAGQLTVPAATFTQNADGTWTVTPGVSVLTVTGNI